MVEKGPGSCQNGKICREVPRDVMGDAEEKIDFLHLFYAVHRYIWTHSQTQTLTVTHITHTQTSHSVSCTDILSI